MKEDVFIIRPNKSAKERTAFVFIIKKKLKNKKKIEMLRRVGTEQNTFRNIREDYDRSKVHSQRLGCYKSVKEK